MIESIDVNTDGNAVITVKGNTVVTHWDEPKAFITGVGHSGTNLLLGMVRATEQYNLTIIPEDRHFGAGLTLLLNFRYMAKLACDSTHFNLTTYYNNMQKFTGLKTLLVVRHPFDAILSGAYRGLPIAMGGDSERTAPLVYDKVEAEETLRLWKMNYVPMLLSMIHTYGQAGRALMFKMEDIVLQTQKVAKEVSNFLGVGYKRAMAEPWKWNIHRGQNQRYQGELDTSQVDVYKRWKTAYNGFFADKKDYVYTIAEGITDMANLLNYEVKL